ncbi:MAG: hypothetical protein KC619_23700 [Myxococcales bacterium]|nr:hypothetical protein [Myxococcales bacterium]
MRRSLLALALLALPGIAYAHPAVDRATALVLDGDYEAARPAIDAALARDDLTREDLVALLEARALLLHGAGDTDGLDAALTALASFAPTHTFGPRFPPDLAARSVAVGREMRGRLRVVVAQVPSAVGVRLEARVENDRASIVRRVRIRVFDAALGQWREAEPPLEATAGRELLVFVEAVGPGGAVLASEGSADAPIHLRGPGFEEASPSRAPEGATRADEGGGVDPWVVVAIVGAALVVVGSIVAISVYAVENPSVEWQPSLPTAN